MRNFVKYFLVGVLIFAFAVPVYADSEVSVTGQLRLRGEIERKSFDTTFSHFQDYSLLRSRVNVKAQVDNNAYAFVQFQDSRTFGVNGQSGTLNDGKNVDIHQAFIKAKLWDKEKWNIGFLAGRFEVNWGNERLLGGVGWSNIGRSWEGGLLWYDAEKFNFTFASLKAIEMNDFNYNRDYDAFAGMFKFKDFNLDLLALYEINADTNNIDIPDAKTLKRMTFGAFYTRTYEQLDFTMNFAYQTGNQADEDIQEDIAAMMFAFEGGYNFKGERAGRFALGIDYASGDDDWADTDCKEFNNLFFTGHKFNGYMDYFTGGGPNGLMDLYASGKFEFTPGWFVKGDFHLFSAAQDYYSYFDGTATKDIGSEFDLTVTTTRVKGIKMTWGASIFMAKDHFAGIESDGKQSGLWLYEMTTLDF